MMMVLSNEKNSKMIKSIKMMIMKKMNDQVEIMKKIFHR